MFIDLVTALAPLAAHHPYLLFIGIVVWCLTQIIVAVAKAAITAWLKQPKPPSTRGDIPRGLSSN